MNHSNVSDPRNSEYWAFISYRHTDNIIQDREWASWLHQEIERYEVPAELIGTENPRGDVIPDKIYPVFRDEESLPADANLASSIVNALDRSKFLVALCSPGAVVSKYVSQEIQHFKTSDKGDRIIAAIIAGEPGDKDTECFPAPLREIVTPDGKLSEPIASDFRLFNGKEGFTSSEAYRRELLKSHPKKQAEKLAENYDERLQLMKLKIIAGILGVPLETLRDRDKAYQLAKQKKQSRQLKKWLAVVSLFALIAFGSGYLAWTKQQEAIRQTELVKIEKEKVQTKSEEQKKLLWQASEADCEAGIRARNNGQLNEALSYYERALKYASHNQRISKQALNTLLFKNAPTTRFAQKFNDSLTCIAFSHDDSFIAAGSQDDSLRLFNLQGKELWRRNFGGPVTSLAVSPINSNIAAGSDDKTLRLFDTKGNELWKQELGGRVTSVGFSPDGSFIAAGSNDTPLYLYDMQGHLIWKRNLGANIYNLSISRDGSKIAASTYDNFVYLFDKSGEEIWKRKFDVNPRYWGKTLMFSPDGLRIGLRVDDCKTFLILGLDGKEICKTEFEGHIFTFDFSPDNSQIAISADSKIYLIDSFGNKIWERTPKGVVGGLLFSPDGSRLATWSGNRSSSGGNYTVTILDTDGNDLARIKSQAKIVAFSSDGTHIAVGTSENNSIYLLDTTNIKYVELSNSKLLTSRFTENIGSMMVASRSLISAYSRKSEKRWHLIYDPQFTAYAFSPDGSFIAIALPELFKIIDIEGNHIEERIIKSPVSAMDIIPVSYNIVEASTDNHVRIFEKSGKLLWAKEFAHPATVLSVSPDGKTIAIGLANQSLHLLDSGGNEIWKRNSGIPIKYLYFSQHGSRINVRSSDDEVSAYDIGGNMLWLHKAQDEDATFPLYDIPDFCDKGLILHEISEAIRSSQNDTTLLQHWLRLECKQTLDINGKPRMLDVKELKQVHTTITSSQSPEKKTALNILLQWEFSPPLQKTIAPSSSQPMRNILSQWLRSARGPDRIGGIHARAPWHPLVPVSLARMARNGHHDLRKRFLCQLTLQRLHNADPKIWGKELLSQDTAFAAETMQALQLPLLAEKAAHLSNTLSPNPAAWRVFATLTGKTSWHDLVLKHPSVTAKDFGNAASAAAKNNNLPRTRKILQIAHEKLPANEYLYRHQGWAMMTLKEFPNALNAFKKAVSLTSKPTAIDYLDLAEAYYLCKQTAKAIESYTKAIQINKEWASEKSITDSNWSEFDEKTMLQVLTLTLKMHPELKPNNDQ